MILYSFILIPIILGTLLYIFKNRLVKVIAYVFQGLVFLLAIYNFIDIFNNGTIYKTIGGYQSFIGISLMCDKLSAALIVLCSFIFLICFLFGLMDKYINHLFVFLFITLESLIMGLFLTRDLFNIFVLFEVSTIIVSILIMFKKDNKSVYDGMIYLITNSIAMTMFLFGVAFLYKTFGSLNMDIIAENMVNIQNPKVLIIPFSLMMTGVGIKCAFLPLFSWLPKAHGTSSAPAIVSVILSALYVKGSIYLFIRLNHMFIDAINMNEFFLVLGALSAVAGFVLAFGQKDVKLILAYHTVSQLGLVVIGVCAGNMYSYYGGILHIFNHAIFKSVLFLCVGIIVEKYKTRDIDKISGVFKSMPIISIAAILAILGITGAPLFNGSVSKYLIQSGLHGGFIEYTIILINLGTIFSFVKFSKIFKGDKKDFSIKIHKKIAVLILGSMCLIMGLTGTFIIKIIFDYSIDISLMSYLEKLVIYILSMGFAYLVYEKILKKTKLIKKGYKVELGLNMISILTVSFLAILIIVTYLHII